MRNAIRFSTRPRLEEPSLIVAWDQDPGGVGPRAIEHLNKALNARPFCEIEPADFFSLKGVEVENDLAVFPDESFYCGDRADLIMLKATEPEFQPYRFLDTILDVAVNHCGVKNVLVVGTCLAHIAHTADRHIFSVSCDREIVAELAKYDIVPMTWEGPPAITTYLIWAANRRNTPAAGILPMVPFYLTVTQDLKQVRAVLSFLGKRFNLRLDLRELDDQIRDQDNTMDRLRQEDPEVDDWIRELELHKDLAMDHEEEVELAKRVTEHFREDEL